MINNKNIYYNEKKDLFVFRETINISILNSFCNFKNFTEQKEKIEVIKKRIYKELEFNNTLNFRITNLKKSNNIDLIISFPIYKLEKKKLDINGIIFDITILEEEIINLFDKIYLENTKFI